MKQIYTLLIFSLLGNIGFSQPSESTIKADLKKKFPTATTILLTSAGSTKKEFENNIYQTVYRRDVSITEPSNNPAFPNVKTIHYGAVRYDLTNGKYVFSRYLVGDSELIGMPDPDKGEIMNMVDSNLTEIFRLGIRNEIIGLPQKFELVKDTKFTWHNFNSVTFKAFTSYERFINDIGDAQEEKQVYAIRLYREETGTWNKLIASSIESEKTILSTKKYTTAQREQLKSFEMIISTSEAEKKWKSLKPINFPEMKDMHDVKDFVHSYFYGKSSDEIESLLYQMLASFYFVKPDFKVLTSDGKALIDKTLQATATGEFLYKDQFCVTPEIKEVGNGYIDYWNKDKSAYTRLAIGTENNQWKLGGITIYINSIPEKAKAISAVPCGNGVLSVVARGEREGVSKLKLNDVVLAYYETDGLWYPSYYLGYSNYYYDVQYFMDNAKGKVRKVVPYTPTIGDKGWVKTQAGTLVEVTILSVKKLDVEIDFNGTKTPYKLSGIMFKK
jgi:hypothetical protein